MHKPCLLLVVVPAVLSLVSGCASVQPWEKEKLSDYTMQPDRDKLADALADHVYFSREASTGGRGVGGGGCGCN